MDVWNKPWTPEIDWLDPYFNLSAVSQEIIDGIALGTDLPNLFEMLQVPGLDGMLLLK